MYINSHGNKLNIDVASSYKPPTSSMAASTVGGERGCDLPPRARTRKAYRDIIFRLLLYRIPKSRQDKSLSQLAHCHLSYFCQSWADWNRSSLAPNELLLSPHLGGRTRALSTQVFKPAHSKNWNLISLPLSSGAQLSFTACWIHKTFWGPLNTHQGLLVIAWQDLYVKLITF